HGPTASRRPQAAYRALAKGFRDADLHFCGAAGRRGRVVGAHRASTRAGTGVGRRARVIVLRMTRAYRCMTPTRPDAAQPRRKGNSMEQMDDLQAALAIPQPWAQSKMIRGEQRYALTANGEAALGKILLL